MKMEMNDEHEWKRHSRDRLRKKDKEKWKRYLSNESKVKETERKIKKHNEIKIKKETKT